MKRNSVLVAFIVLFLFCAIGATAHASSNDTSSGSTSTSTISCSGPVCGIYYTFQLNLGCNWNGNASGCSGSYTFAPPNIPGDYSTFSGVVTGSVNNGSCGGVPSASWPMSGSVFGIGFSEPGSITNGVESSLASNISVVNSNQCLAGGGGGTGSYHITACAPGYSATGDRTCTLVTPPPPQPPQLGLSELTFTTGSNTALPVSSHAMDVLNTGGSNLNWNSVVNTGGPYLAGYSPVESGQQTGMLPPWLHIAEAQTVPGGDTPVTFSFDQTKVSALSAANSAQVTFSCTTFDNCKGNPSVPYNISYTVPSPSIGTFTAGAVKTGQQPVLSWTNVQNYNLTASASKAICFSGTDHSSWCTAGVANGSMTAPYPAQGTVTYTMTVVGLSDQSGATGNTVTKQVTVTPSAVSLTCSVSPSSATQASVGQSESFIITTSGGDGLYKWSANGGAYFPSSYHTSPYTYVVTAPGSYAITAESQDNPPAAGTCGSFTVNPPPAGSPTSTFSITDTTLGITSTNTAKNPIFYIGDSWTVNVMTANIPNGTMLQLCTLTTDGQVNECQPTSTSMEVMNNSWQYSGTFPWTTIPDNYREYVQFPSIGLLSNSASYQVTQGSGQNVSCSIGVTPASFTGSAYPTVSWSSADASACQAAQGSPGWAESRATGGTWTSPTPITQTTQFSMTCESKQNSGQIATCVGSPATSQLVGITAVTVSPSQANISISKTQQFTATVSGSGNFNPAVTWSVNGVSGNTTIGTISDAGLYTAPASVPNPAGVTVRAISQQDATKSGIASVTITSGGTTHAACVNNSCTEVVGQQTDDCSIGSCVTSNFHIACVNNSCTQVAGNQTNDPGCSLPSSIGASCTGGGTNTVSLTASSNPTTVAPVTLMATASSTAVGTMNYTFWWNCPAYDTASNPTVAGATAACGDPTNAANGQKFSAVNVLSEAPTHTYATAGTYHPIVILERGSAAAALGTVTVNVVQPAQAASCVSISAPVSVTPGQIFSTTVIMKNLGTATWQSIQINTSTPYRLGSEDNNLTGVGRVDFSQNTIAPGAQVTFTFPGTATTTLGTYNFDWQMLQEGGAWFGGICTSTVTVNSTSGGPDFSLTASPTSLSIPQGGSGEVTVLTAPTGGGVGLALRSLLAALLPIFASGGTVPQTPVLLSLSGLSSPGTPLPGGMTGSFSPTNSITPPGNATTTILVPATTPTGNYTVYIIGSNGSNSHYFQLPITVTGGGTPHAACVNNSCTEVVGQQSDDCSSGSCITGNFHIACVNNSCTQVAGGEQNDPGCSSIGESCGGGGGCTPGDTQSCVSGPNSCGEVNAGVETCNSSGSWNPCSAVPPPNSSCGGTPHAACVNNSCAEVVGQPTDDCSPVNSTCSSSQFHDICQNNSCTQVTGAGYNDPGCSDTTIGDSCTGGNQPPVCSQIAANPAGTIVPPEMVTLSWNCSPVGVFCSVNGTAVSASQSGNYSAQVNPTVTTQYNLNCSNSGGTASSSVIVTVGGTGVHEVNP